MDLRPLWNVWSGTSAAPVAFADHITDPVAAFAGLGAGEYDRGYYYFGGKPGVAKQTAVTTLNLALTPAYLAHFFAIGLAGQFAELALVGRKDNLEFELSSFEFKKKSIEADAQHKTLRDLHAQWLQETIAEIDPGLKALKGANAVFGGFETLWGWGNPLIRSLQLVFESAATDQGQVFPAKQGLASSEVAEWIAETYGLKDQAFVKHYWQIGFVSGWRFLIKRAEDVKAYALQKLDELRSV